MDRGRHPFQICNTFMHSPEDDKSLLIETSSCTPVLFRTNYYSIEIPHGVTAIILTYTFMCSQTLQHGKWNNVPWYLATSQNSYQVSF